MATRLLTRPVGCSLLTWTSRSVLVEGVRGAGLCRGEVLAVREAESLTLATGVWPGQRAAPAARGGTAAGWRPWRRRAKAGPCWAEENEGPPGCRRGR